MLIYRHYSMATVFRMARSKHHNPIKQIKNDIDGLRKGYTKALSGANKAIYDGMEQLAEHELNAIRTHYSEALQSLSAIRSGGSPGDLAIAQLQFLQETIDRVLSNARQSLAILDNTRREVSEQFRDGWSDNEKTVKDIGEAAQEAAERAANKARAQASRYVDEAGDQAENAAADLKTEAREAAAKAGDAVPGAPAGGQSASSSGSKSSSSSGAAQSMPAPKLLNVARVPNWVIAAVERTDGRFPG